MHLKNALLALALCTLVGTASAHDKKGKTTKSGNRATTCTMKGGSCCAKKDAKTAHAKAPAATPAAKPL